MVEAVRTETTKRTLADELGFSRHWVCQVVRSGYHNGARCSPSDPHEGWGCAYRWESSLPDLPQIREALES